MYLQRPLAPLREAVRNLIPDKPSPFSCNRISSSWGENREILTSLLTSRSRTDDRSEFLLSLLLETLLKISCLGDVPLGFRNKS